MYIGVAQNCGSGHGPDIWIVSLFIGSADLTYAHYGYLAAAALFLEIHDDPDRAKSDPATVYPLNQLHPLLERLLVPYLLRSFDFSSPLLAKEGLGEVLEERNRHPCSPPWVRGDDVEQSFWKRHYASPKPVGRQARSTYGLGVPPIRSWWCSLNCTTASANSPAIFPVASRKSREPACESRG